MIGKNGHKLPPELAYTGRLRDALRFGRILKKAGAHEKDIAKAILRKLKESEPKDVEPRSSR